MTGAGSGGGGGYDYVEAFYPSDADEGESLYHLTENAAYVYSGSEWIEQTVTDHSQLSGVNEGDHRSDQRVSDLAPVQTRYADSEARTAVDGSNVSVGYADDAGSLGGQSPSNYETPSSTEQAYAAGGNTKVGQGYIDVNYTNIGYVGDQVEVRHEDGSGDAAYINVYINGQRREDDYYFNSGSRYYNLSLGVIDSVRVEDNRSDTLEVSVYVSRPPVSPHSHNI